jgi:hypothetical protein
MGRSGFRTVIKGIQEHTTDFMRLGPIYGNVARIADRLGPQTPIHVFAGSDGSEARTLASVMDHLGLRKQHPITSVEYVADMADISKLGLQVEMPYALQLLKAYYPGIEPDRYLKQAPTITPDTIEAAVEDIAKRKQVPMSQIMREYFKLGTYQHGQRAYEFNPEIDSSIQYRQGDITQDFLPSDQPAVVLFNNQMYHWTLKGHPDAGHAMNNLNQLAKGSVLVTEGQPFEHYSQVINNGWQPVGDTQDIVMPTDPELDLGKNKCFYTKTTDAIPRKPPAQTAILDNTGNPFILKR